MCFSLRAARCRESCWIFSIKNHDNKLLRRNEMDVIPGAIFPGIFTATPDTLLYYFHFIPRINYRVALKLVCHSLGK